VALPPSTDRFSGFVREFVGLRAKNSRRPNHCFYFYGSPPPRGSSAALRLRTRFSRPNFPVLLARFENPSVSHVMDDGSRPWDDEKSDAVEILHTLQ
jgi:hypothetical protein